MKKMVHKLSVAVAAAVLLASGAGFPQRGTDRLLAAESQQMDYLALGDSISAAYGLASPETEGFPYLIAGEAAYTISNHAVSGYTAEDIAVQLESGALDDTIADAELITITCGGNDLMALLYEAIAARYNAQMNTKITAQDVVNVMIGGSSAANRTMLILCAKWVLLGEENKGTLPFAESQVFEAGLAEYTEHMEDVMAYIRSLNDRANVIVATQYNPYKLFASSDFEALAIGCGDGAKRLNETITNNAAAFDYVTADVYTAFETAEENLCNAALSPLNIDFHPNAAGHAVIAETFLSVLETLPVPEQPTTEPTTEPTPEPTNPPTFSGYRYEAQCREQYYLSEDVQEFDPADLITSLLRIEVFSPGGDGAVQTMTDVSIVDFEGLTPQQVYAQQDAPYYQGNLTAMVSSQVIELGPVSIGLKGDANLDGVLNAGDASAILVYAALKGANLESFLYSAADTALEQFAYYLADVTGESKDYGADGSALDAVDAAAVLTYAAVQGAQGSADWTEILAS